MDALLASELSAETLAALQAHLAATQIADESADDEVSEDFRLSQFWYDDVTGEALAREALEMSKGGPIAFLSTPAAYKALKKLEPERKNVYIFEYDHRFGQKYGDEFVFYDYNAPLDVDAKFHNFFDYVLVEPPYLTEQCMKGFGETMKLISREVVPTDHGKKVMITPNVFINSGALKEAMADELGLTPSGFVPTFESKLSNRLTTYVNYSSERFGKYEA
ncbi:hypothetical protein H257_17972 [Aphanomyces astaci]|uniref:Protein-lysine N-methyltransferase n=1 Tax=Aphanomyces astaci TaxID=112090 RepID=W4FCM6_APHAT|nr:hypothetical protein H257_17972 [Aphanomyces astaci]ETV65252.1 hypothetical protein H257_17972 [Aphanomyces astaci]|eukprot:XP_009845253.1 hypothetical protein H257_17972 [Aphanomyces astaci]